jgi:hypothetical protein
MESAWAAGFFDGEGSSYVAFGHPRKDGSRLAYVRVRAAQNHREPLDRLQAELGGTVTGPYKTGMFAWQMQASKEVPKAMARLWPFLGTAKKQQYISARERANTNNGGTVV